MAAYGSTDGRKEILSPAKDEPQGTMEHVAPYLAEFIGTFLIVFTMCSCMICGDPMWNPTGIAFLVLVLVYSFGSVSGAHLNPAVTLTLGFVLKFPWAKCLGYIVAQIAGGFAGSLTIRYIFGQTVKLGPPENASIQTHFQWYDVAAIEAIYTFLLSFVFINCVASIRNNKPHDQNHFFGIAIGFVYIAGGYSALNISGSIFNPAASLAIGVTSQKWNWVCIYTLAQVAGAWLASVIFAVVRPEDFPMQYDGNLEDFSAYLRSKLVAELIGTFVIVLTVGLNLVMLSPAGPWSSAACYVCLLYSLGDVSGGHFNPAVTLAVMLTGRKKCSFALGQSYIWAQLVGGVAAGFLGAYYNIVGAQKDWPLEPQKGYDWYQAGAAETVFTALLAWVFLAVATTTMAPSTTETNFYYGLAIGSVITIGGFAIGNVSGWSLNPAVALGRGVAQVVTHTVMKNDSSLVKLLNVVWYSCFELAGGALAAGLFFVTHQREYLKDLSDGVKSWSATTSSCGYPHIP